MSDPHPMNGGQPPYAVGLAEVARKGRLAIYTGAGLSRALPSGIPDGAEVSRRCHKRLSDALGADALDGVDPSNLTAVADAMSALENGTETLRQTAVKVADFTSAPSNFSHEILALLLLEGATVVITTNWDDCIERAGGEERVLAVVSDLERRQIQTPALLKVHGCATRPDTALITTEELKTPPDWARDEVNARLSDSQTVFVGIGDVAGYVRSRIEEARNAVGADGAVFVVSPGIRSDWEGSQWAEILPELPEERRLAATSDEFLDYLAGAYVRGALSEIGEALQPEQLLSIRFHRAKAAFEAASSVQALRWLRSYAVKRGPGASVLAQQSLPRALIAVGSLCGDEVAFDAAGRAVCADHKYELLVGVGTVTSGDFRREAERRFTRYRSAGDSEQDIPTFLVAGCFGRLDGTSKLKRSVLDQIDAFDILAGPTVVEPMYVHAEDHVA